MFGVITAVANERDAVLGKMREVQPLTLFDIEFYQGLIGNTPCVIAMSGVGKVNAARSTQLMIDRFNPAHIVNIGSAGAIHPDLTVGDVIISTLSIQHDVDLTAFGIKRGAFDEQESGFVETDKEFAELCREVMERYASGQFSVRSGPIVTGDQFNDSPQKMNELYQEFGAYCIEMEGAAVAQVCAMCQIPFVIIRSISDTPDNDTRMMYERNKVLAAERCADFLADLIDVLEKKYAKRGQKEPMKQVESFALDHDRVTAPYVRKAKVMTVNPKFPDCLISKYDVRFAQPNQRFISNDALHTLEHLFAVYVRKYTDELIDVSPMGCRTGFYFTFCGDKDPLWVAGIVRKALTEALDWTGDVPGAVRKECGNYLEHDLDAAKLWARRFLAIPEEDVIEVFRGK